MSDLPTCQTADFFVLRTPGLPLDALTPPGAPGREAEPQGPSRIRLEQGREALRQTLRELLQREVVREAVALASPDLASRLGAWFEGSLAGPAARNIERALLKYLSRMSSRATPFGLFAGVSMGAWGPASRLSAGPWRQCRKAMRLDWGVLETLVDGLEREPEVRASLRYRPNSSLYPRGGWYRYLERRESAGGRTYHLEAVEATPHLDWVLQQAAGGSRLQDLAKGLGRLGVAPPAAQAFLEQLVDAQVLCGNLQPPLTRPDPMGQVIAALQAHPSTAPRAALLIALEGDLKALQGAPLGGHPEGHRSLAGPLEPVPKPPAHGVFWTGSLAALGIPADTRDVLQADLFRPSPELALSPRVRRALEEGAETLRRLTPAPAESPMDRFRAAFQERYGSRWMPLLEVLDEESGLGFDGGAPMDSPLLEGLSFQRSAPPRPLSGRDRFLLKQLPRWQGSLTWALEDADVEALAQPNPPPFPHSFAALTSLEAASPAALDRGDFRFWMEHHSGPTAARWLGRFASGDAALQAALQSHLRREESRRPGALFAEVVHVPEGRMGNVLARPALREYEIPFLATAGVSTEHTLLPSDLQVTVRGERVWLASTRLGREVVPRLSSAHNFARGPAVYRFLSHLQDQDGRPGGWSWGALAEQPFLPRVTRGRHVLSKARWRIEARELQAAMKASPEGAWGAFQALRQSLGLPRFLMLTEADNSLLVDLDQVLWAETLQHLVSSRPAFTLTECFPDPGQALVTSPEGSFAHELVIPFEAILPAPSKSAAHGGFGTGSKASPFPALSAGPSPRAYPPGSEWLYLKLYCGPASADRLLVELAPLLHRTAAEGLWDRWHFVRYQDPDHHLRLRFHGLPARLLADLLPQLHGHLEGGLAEGLLWKWQVDTFAPEWERYGGPVGLALAEGWFFEDSQRILADLAGGLSLEQRWRAGLRNTDAIWAALGLSVQARKGLAQEAREGFRKEFADLGDQAVQMGARFRGLRQELEPGFAPVSGAASGAASGASSAPGFGGLTQIREAFDQGLIQGDRAPLALSLSHMHLNRLLRTDHRESEWVLMEFLVRLYESRLARSPGL